MDILPAFRVIIILLRNYDKYTGASVELMFREQIP